jgi:hypothetical protein
MIEEVAEERRPNAVEALLDISFSFAQQNLLG